MRLQETIFKRLANDAAAMERARKDRRVVPFKAFDASRQELDHIHPPETITPPESNARACDVSFQKLRKISGGVSQTEKMALHSIASLYRNYSTPSDSDVDHRIQVNV